jgi:DMSO reductase family type II enzyme heme b subunit
VVRVRALHDGTRLMMRLEWDDATEDKLLAPARFSDGVAVQFPARGGEAPNAFMGEAGKPVRIHFWRAAWQDPAMNAPEKVVKALYPNAVVDHYPFDAAKTKEQRAAMAVQYAPAVAAGNPGSPPPEGSGAPRTGTTQDLEAEGFGTLTPLPRGAPRSSGQGVWKKGVWRVALSLPIAGGALAPGKRTYVAFALWDGGEKQVGARKMRSNWISLALDAGPRAAEARR